jgi:uncharacterized protein YacL
MEDLSVEKRHKRLCILGVVLLIALTVFFAFISKVVSSLFFDERGLLVYAQGMVLIGILMFFAFYLYVGGYTLFAFVIMRLTIRNKSYNKLFIILGIVGLIISLIYGINASFLSKLE